MIKAIIFDKDGTLFDFQATWGGWAGALLDQMCAGDDEKKRNLAADLNYDLSRREVRPNSVIVAGTPIDIAQVMARYFPALTAPQIVKNLNNLALTAPQVPVADFTNVLGKLRKMGLKLAVMTNDAQAPATAHLQSGGAADYFDCIIGSDSGYGAKPAPDPLLAISKILNISPTQCAMVGDSTHDLRAAKAARMRGIGVLTGLAGANDLRPFADDLLPSIADLPHWVAKSEK